MHPLAVADIGLGPSAAAVQLARLDEKTLEPLRFEVLEPGNPVDAGGFQGHGGDAGLSQMVGDGVQVGGVGAEGTDLPRPDADDVVVGVDVDAGGVRVLHRECRGVVPIDGIRVGRARLGFQLAARPGIGYLERTQKGKPRCEGEGPG